MWINSAPIQPGISAGTIPRSDPLPSSPFSVEFRTDIRDTLTANWNPFPGELERETIEAEFDRNWKGTAETTPVFASGASCDCVRCEWDKTADPSPEQIRQYFDTAVPGLFDNRMLDLLACW